MELGDALLGWTDELAAAWLASDPPRPPQPHADGGDTSTRQSDRPLLGRVSRLDRGWSSVLYRPGQGPARVRNIGADVAVGDWVLVSADGERVERVAPRHSAFVRRASFEGDRAEAHTLAANVDVVVLVHALTAPPNQRRLERELVLAWDSGARPVVVLTKSDLVEPSVADAALGALGDAAPGVELLVASGISGAGMDSVESLAGGRGTLAFLGASGVGKSTLINSLVGSARQHTADVRDDQKGRHTTTAAELIGLPGGGWLIDTPGVRAVSLWSSGHGIERAFADLFDLADGCRFRDCKHEDEPGCAVQAAIATSQIDPRRLDSMKRLVAEEAALEAEQEARLKVEDRRGFRRPRPVRPARPR